MARFGFIATELKPYFLTASIEQLYRDAEADALLARIQSGEMSFGDAASEFSACPSRNKKGFLGQFTSLSSILFLPYEGQDVPEFDAAVWSSPIGEVSAVTTSFGVHLLRVDARGSPE